MMAPKFILLRALNSTKNLVRKSTGQQTKAPEISKWVLINTDE